MERSRDFGECYLALSLWHRLGLDSLLAELFPSGRKSVGWAHTAALLTVARFFAQRSELCVAEHWYERKESIFPTAELGLRNQSR